MRDSEKTKLAFIWYHESKSANYNVQVIIDESQLRHKRLFIG